MLVQTRHSFLVFKVDILNIHHTNASMKTGKDVYGNFD